MRNSCPESFNLDYKEEVIYVYNLNEISIRRMVSGKIALGLNSQRRKSNGEEEYILE